MRASRSLGKALAGPLVLVAMLLPFSVAQAQQVSPFQAGHYYPGLMNIRDLATPDPGIYLTWYNLWGVGGTFYDRDGNAVDRAPVGDPPTEVSLGVQSGGTAPSFTGVFDLGGSWRYMAIVTPSFVGGNASVIFVDAVEGQQVVDSVFGFGDLAVAPLFISYGSDIVDVTGGYTVYVPTGRYATGADDNLGLGHWTHQFQLAGYLYFLEKASALMLNLTYEVPSSIFDVDVRPGSRFTVEYGFSQYVTDWLELGVIGGNSFQVTDETGGDVSWDGSVYDRKSTIAGSVGLWATDWLQVTVKRWWEYGVRQRFKIDGYQLNLTFILSMSGED